MKRSIKDIEKEEQTAGDKQEEVKMKAPKVPAPKNIVYLNYGCENREKVAGFDLDSTWIVTKSGKTFATNAKDWQWWDDSVPTVLKDYYKKGFKIVLFSNQAGIEKGHTSVKEFTTKINYIQKELNIPIEVFASIVSDDWRKPNLGMWKYFC